MSLLHVWTALKPFSCSSGISRSITSPTVAYAKEFAQQGIRRYPGLLGSCWIGSHTVPRTFHFSEARLICLPQPHVVEDVKARIRFVAATFPPEVPSARSDELPSQIEAEKSFAAHFETFSIHHERPRVLGQT
jgi:hypothetical protein